MSTHPFDTSSFAGVKLKHVPSYAQSEAADYNLRVAAWFDNYAANAAQVDRAMADEDKLWKMRSAEGWEADEGGWYTPTGISEHDWEHDYGNPFPEEPVWENYKALKRCTAGWRIDDSGWYSPEGQHESEWTGPFPEYTLL